MNDNELKNETSVEDNILMQILHKNRNHAHCVDMIIRSGMALDYFEIKPQHLIIIEKLMQDVSRKVNYDGKMVVEMDLGKFRKYDREPEYSLEKLKEIQNSHLNNSVKYLLNSPECEEEIKFLSNRFIDKEDIIKYSIGSTKYFKNKEEFKDTLGISVHPSIVGIMKSSEVEGLIIPFTKKGNLVGTAIRAVPHKHMKFSTSLPDLLIGNIDNLLNPDIKEVFLVEGFFDSIALERIGFDNTFFIHSANPSIPQVACIMNSLRIHNKKLILGLDSDIAGTLSNLKMSFICDIFGVQYSFIQLEGPKDHAEAVHKYNYNKEKYESLKVQERENLLSKVEENNKNEAKIVSYEEYIGLRKEVSVNFKR